MFEGLEIEKLRLQVATLTARCALQADILRRVTQHLGVSSLWRVEDRDEHSPTVGEALRR